MQPHTKQPAISTPKSSHILSYITIRDLSFSTAKWKCTLRFTFFPLIQASWALLKNLFEQWCRCRSYIGSNSLWYDSWKYLTNGMGTGQIFVLPLKQKWWMWKSLCVYFTVQFTLSNLFSRAVIYLLSLTTWRGLSCTCGLTKWLSEFRDSRVVANV